MSRDLIPSEWYFSRRKFLQLAASTLALFGVSPLWPLKDSPQAAIPNKRHHKKCRTKHRTYIFNLSHLDTSRHDIILVAGKQRVKLNQMSPGDIKKARREHPIFRHVPSVHMTHHITLSMPEDALQLCYLQRVVRGSRDGNWDMAFLFYHFPIRALQHARKRILSQNPNRLPKVHVKWQRYGITPRMLAAFNDPVGEAMLLDTSDQATAMVAGHPELACGEPNSAAHIQNNIIGTESSTQDLGDYIATNDWATQKPLINPDTGLQAVNSQGQLQFIPVWTTETGQNAYPAITTALKSVKDDRTLGSNVTDIDPETVPDNDPVAPTYGTVWAIQDGMPTVNQAGSTLLQETSIKVNFVDQTPGHGYSLDIDSVAENAGKVSVTFTARNHFVRYLSLFVRYLDGNDQPLLLSDIEDEIKEGFESWDLGLNSDYDAYLELVAPMWTFLGMPLKTTTLRKTIPMPPQAASVLILAGGLGTGGNAYPGTLDPGRAMTIVFNICAPSILLSFMAAAGFSTLTRSLESSETIREVIEVLISLFFDLFATVSYDDPEVFEDLAVEIGQKLLSKAAGKINQLIAESIAEGETIEAVEDAIPVLGVFLSAMWAVGLIAQLAETSSEVSKSPQTYIDKITLTHNISVTIAHDPDDPAGFPATATYYIITAIFDEGTPHHSPRQDMPGTTVTEPLTYTFTDVPGGGLVKVDVAFYSDTGFLVGHGFVGPVPNDPALNPLALAITITEVLVPLTAKTLYSHKEIIQLDNSGNHIWHATTTPPAVQTPQGICDNINGHICSWTDITVSTVNASVGYAWQSYNTAVTDSVSGGLGQLHQFANISSTQNPQSGYLFSGSGFSGVTRIVYDLMADKDVPEKSEWNFYLDPTNGNYFIRQIRLSPGGVSSYDSPTSNKAFGRLHFSSDALLLHPAGKIISINSSFSMMEVLDLQDSAVADAEAPMSQLRSGVGTREGLMKGPIHAALTAQGTILILEQKNKRIQAFDLGGNPVPYFANGAYYVALDPSGKLDPAGNAIYLDLAVEFSGYLYVLSYTGNGPFTYHLDLYNPDGSWLARTSGINADKLAVNYWRDLFTLNYQVLTLPNGSIPNRTEPSISHWIPSTP